MSEQYKTIFSPSSEKTVTRALVRAFVDDFDEIIESDAIIVGGGPSGLMCGKVLAEQNVNVVIIERNNYLGGGFWVGGYLMNKVIFREPSHKILDEIGVPYKEVEQGLFVSDGPHACSKLIAAACDAGAKVLNMTSVDDIVIKEENRIAGVVINWTPIQFLPRQIASLDPVALESKIVIDATGHDAVLVRLLAQRGFTQNPECGPMWIDKSEDDVVNHTGFIHPGLLVIGMSVSSAYKLNRMGPSFGAMLLSGIKGAEIALEYLRR